MLFPTPSKAYIGQVMGFQSDILDTISVSSSKIPMGNIYYKKKNDREHIYQFAYVKARCISFVTTGERINSILPIFAGDEKLLSEQSYHLFYIYGIKEYENKPLIEAKEYKIWNFK